MSKFIESQYKKYKENTNVDTFMIHQINFNLSQHLGDGVFKPELYISFTFDYFNYYMIATANFKGFNDNGYEVKISRNMKSLNVFSEDDFIFETAKSTINSHKYMKAARNNDIQKLINEHYYLKNIVKYVITDDENPMKIIKVFSSRNLMTPEEINKSLEVVAKPKIIVRMFKHRKKDSILAVFNNHRYLQNDFIYIPEKHTFEFMKKITTVYVEITPRKYS